ncbi:FxsA family protein [Pseudaestuariivita atlantica]|uniref:Exlusion protein FxsA n=1 Tax=Pseudaestuariivita atlantica TaxID=1317121 RepID=A0A0L1JPR4_9RHOB|nr:FxsA family protein [Pseudaestuariivita atlantica]KNG93707.1 exlusion protein FxsA [Pseudaestuariivita atlantica]
MWLFLAFLAVPLIEIALFIQIGGLIGLWPTLLIVILTAIAGTILVRSQGAVALSQLRGSMERLQDPTGPLAHGAMILFAGALLLTPGFFTDALGFALLMPPVRNWVIRFVRSRIKVQSFQMGAGPTRPDARRHEGTVIDGDYSEVTEPDPPKRPTHRPSGWTKH